MIKVLKTAGKIIMWIIDALILAYFIFSLMVRRRLLVTGHPISKSFRTLSLMGAKSPLQTSAISTIAQRATTMFAIMTRHLTWTNSKQFGLL